MGVEGVFSTKQDSECSASQNRGMGRFVCPIPFGRVGYTLSAMMMLIALALGLQSSDEFYKRGLEKAKAGDHDGALLEFTRAIEADPKHTRAYLNRGLSKARKGDIDGSIPDFTRALELDPKYAMAYNNRGYARRMKRDFDSAIADFTRAIELDPKLALAYANRGIAKREKGDVDAAVTDLTRAIECDSKLVLAYGNRGTARESQGDLDGASADFTRAMELDPKNAGAYRSRGFVKLRQSNFEGAIADYTRALELAPKDASVYQARGFIHFARRAWKESLDDFRKSIELEPSRPYPRLLIWLVRCRQGEQAAATEELQRYLKEANKADDDAWVRALARAMAGEMPEEELLKLTESPIHRRYTVQQLKCEAHFYIGSRELLAGRRDAARDRFKKCLETRADRFFEYRLATIELKALEP